MPLGLVQALGSDLGGFWRKIAGPDLDADAPVQTPAQLIWSGPDNSLLACGFHGCAAPSRGHADSRLTTGARLRRPGSRR